jgi:hypothetical protein
VIVGRAGADLSGLRTGVSTFPRSRLGGRHSPVAIFHTLSGAGLGSLPAPGAAKRHERPAKQRAGRTSIPKMGKRYPITRFLDFGGISHLCSQPNPFMARAIKRVSHGSHQSPQSHFAVPTMEGMALGPLPVRTLASLAADRADAQKYTGPSTAEGKAARFLRGTKLPISLETKGGGERQKGEQSYRFARVARRRTGRERLLPLRFVNALTYSARAARRSHSLCIRAWLQPCRKDAFSHQGF